jgi:hypothetical protein
MHLDIHGALRYTRYNIVVKWIILLGWYICYYSVKLFTSKCIYFEDIWLDLTQNCVVSLSVRLCMCLCYIFCVCDSTNYLLYENRVHFLRSDQLSHSAQISKYTNHIVLERESKELIYYLLYFDSTINKFASFKLYDRWHTNTRCNIHRAHLRD